MPTCASLLVASVLAGLGCNRDGANVPEYPPLDDPDPVEVGDPAPSPPIVEAPPPPITVAPGESTPLGDINPRVRIVAPRNEQVIRNGPVMVRIDVRGWELAPDPGPHMHLIVDNEPYIAVRDVSEPIDLNALVQAQLGRELAHGAHVLRVFPGHGHHESAKVPAAFAAVVFHYVERGTVHADGTTPFVFDARSPTLTYSRPKGCSPSGTPLMIDFFLSNVALASDRARVHYTIDDTVHGDITAWVPHHIQNLADGEHTLRLVLVDAEDTPIPGMFNDTTRTIRIGNCN